MWSLALLVGLCCLASELCPVDTPVRSPARHPESASLPRQFLGHPADCFECFLPLGLAARWGGCSAAGGACDRACPRCKLTKFRLCDGGAAMQDSAKTMEQVWEVLQQHTKVSLLQLVLSHASFAQTVENLFALSMLVRTPCPCHIGTPMSRRACATAAHATLSPLIPDQAQPSASCFPCRCQALCKCEPQSACCSLTTAIFTGSCQPQDGLATCR